MGIFLNKYYCKDCGKFKNRFQLRSRFKGLYYVLECKWCHNTNIYLSKEVLQEAARFALKERDKERSLRK